MKLPRETTPLDKLIGDAEAYLRQRYSRPTTHSQECHHWHSDCMVERLLDKLVTVHAIASALEETYRWREIAKEPPRKNRFAIFWSKYEEHCFCPQVIGRFDGTGVEWGGDFAIPIDRFSHWMPLPKHPEFKHGRQNQAGH